MGLAHQLTPKKRRVAVTMLMAIKDADPDQLYFWTPRWQQWEHEADEDIQKGRVKGFNTIEALIADLHR